MAKETETIPATEVDDAAIEAMIAAKVEERMRAIEARFAQVAAATPAAAGADDQLKALITNLGMTFADIANQGVGVQKPVSPDVLEARETSRLRMMALIKDAKGKSAYAAATGEDAAPFIPVYRLRSAVFFDDRRIIESWMDTDHVKQPMEIEWPGIPNHAMEPVNEVAKLIHQAFLDSVGNLGKITKIEEVTDLGVNRGVKVKGELKRTRSAPAPTPFDYEGVRVRHQDGRSQGGKLQHVLGTVAPPAEISG